MAAHAGPPCTCDPLLSPNPPVPAAQNPFDNALHRLRKLIGDTHLVLHAGALSLNPASCWTDVAARETVLREAAALSGDTRNDAAMAMAMAVAEQALATRPAAETGALVETLREP